MKPIFTIVLSAAFLLANGCLPQSTPTPSRPAESTAAPTLTAAPEQDPADIFFDDFQYASQEDMISHGWIIRAKAGWPGIPGAAFRPENISFHDDPQLPGNRLLRMASSTDGTPGQTFQTQVCHQRKYLEGTYAARVYFNNQPASGPDGDQVVETFYAITPYEEPLQPDYSEMDFEYLPNGGWGLPAMTLAFTTWETVQIEPWSADNRSDKSIEDAAGWHTLVVQAMNGTTRYFVDGRQTAAHTGRYYPDAPMSINFNLWFINGGLAGSGETRSYQEDIDWVYHAANTLLAPKQVEQNVQDLRQAGNGFVDTVPPGSPALESPCDL